MSESSPGASASGVAANGLEISPRDVAAMQKRLRNDFLLIDCRSRDEWDVGHIEGAMLLPMQELSLHLGDLREHEDKSIVVMCRSGKRSCTVATVLRAEGFSQVWFMAGGILRWISDVDPSINA